MAFSALVLFLLNVMCALGILDIHFYTVKSIFLFTHNKKIRLYDRYGIWRMLSGVNHNFIFLLKKKSGTSRCDQTQFLFSLQIWYGGDDAFYFGLGCFIRC